MKPFLLVFKHLFDQSGLERNNILTLKIKKIKNKSNERKQITDLISDVNLKLVLVPLGGFRGVKKILIWIPEKGNKNKQKQRQRNK